MRPHHARACMCVCVSVWGQINRTARGAARAWCRPSLSVGTPCPPAPCRPPSPVALRLLNSWGSSHSVSIYRRTLSYLCLHSYMYLYLYEGGRSLYNSANLLLTNYLSVLVGHIYLNLFVKDSLPLFSYFSNVSSLFRLGLYPV